MRLKAMAKINLGLDVVRRREDGYHEVKMIMQTIQLHDDLELSKTKTSGIKVQTNLKFLPVDENNLVYKAAKLLMDEFQVEEGLFIDLKKHIPVAAGMAGGSSDAAAVLVGVNKLFDLGLSRQELMERGVKIGADVPYCIMRGTALSEGIGEKLTALPSAPSCSVLIAKPPFSVSTKFVYENLRLDELDHHPDIDGIRKAIEEQDLQTMASLLENVLETVTIPAHPQIGQLKEIMKEEGALNSLMSGSGPTVFGIFDDEEKADRARDAVEKSGLAKQVYMTRLFQCGGKSNE